MVDYIFRPLAMYVHTLVKSDPEFYSDEERAPQAEGLLGSVVSHRSPHISSAQPVLFSFSRRVLILVPVSCPLSRAPDTSVYPTHIPALAYLAGYGRKHGFDGLGLVQLVCAERDGRIRVRHHGQRLEKSVKDGRFFILNVPG